MSLHPDNGSHPVGGGQPHKPTDLHPDSTPTEPDDGTSTLSDLHPDDLHPDETVPDYLLPTDLHPDDLHPDDLHPDDLPTS